MIEALPISLLILVLATLALLGLLVMRRPMRSEDALESRFETMSDALERLERALREELSAARREAAEQARLAREESRLAQQVASEALLARIGEAGRQQAEALESFARRLMETTETQDRRAEALRMAMDRQLQQLREENAQKLEAMRLTVDEKLQGTLEKRLGESFKQVSERLEQVHQGLGEMQTLASGVGDLKRVMTNIKTRGTWGEVQLGAILEQLLAPEQFATHVVTRPGSSERVEYAIRLPGQQGDENRPVYLPIDAKFPVEDYRRLLDAQEAADAAAVQSTGRQLELSLRNSAREIATKYLAPPHTTDFAVMFLPSEGLYAEVIRRTELIDQLQNSLRVIIAGPTTLAALLNSLQMGFRTLAIQQRSSEVWEVLGTVKTEFGKFGAVLEKVRKKLQEASNTVGEAERRTRVMNRKLRDVQALPGAEAADPLLPLDSPGFLNREEEADSEDLLDN